MTDLRNHMLIWHKQCALVTGGISLTYGRNGIKKSEALDWIERLRNVADDIESVVSGGEFILDTKGQRVVQSGAVKAPLGEPNNEGADDVKPRKSEAQESASKAPVRKVGGLRVAKRKVK